MYQRWYICVDITTLHPTPGFGPNGAVIHYNPLHSHSPLPIDSSQMLLIDSGGQVYIYMYIYIYKSALTLLLSLSPPSLDPQLHPQLDPQLDPRIGSPMRPHPSQPSALTLSPSLDPQLDPQLDPLLAEKQKHILFLSLQCRTPIFATCQK